MREGPSLSIALSSAEPRRIDFFQLDLAMSTYRVRRDGPSKRSSNLGAPVEGPDLRSERPCGHNMRG